MGQILDDIETPYVDSQTLLAHLQGYRNPRDWIARSVKKGELIRLKNGFFVIASRFRGIGRRGGNRPDFPYEQLANLLYGPSYISLEWALAYYGFIPERVSVISSVTVGNNKEFDTPIGYFTFRHLAPSRYSLGIDYKRLPGQLGGFLIATPEKALADWVYFSSEELSKQQLWEDLLEGKRIEVSSLENLERDLLGKIATAYRAPVVTYLYQLIADL